MKCEKCGTENSESAKFCNECGQKLKKPVHGYAVSPETQIRIGEMVYAAHKHRDAGNLEDAILACGGALALNESNAATHVLMGALYEERGDVESSAREYKRALSLEPGNSTARGLLNTLTPEPSAAGSSLKVLLGRARPYIPHGAAVLAALLVLGLAVVVLGSLMEKRGQLRRVAAVEAINTPKGTQYTPPIVPQSPAEQPSTNAAGQPQTSQMIQPQAAPTQTQEAGQGQSTQGTEKRGIAPVPTLQSAKPSDTAKTAPALSEIPSPTQSPVIVPIIEPVAGPASSPNRSGSTSSGAPSSAQSSGSSARMVVTRSPDVGAGSQKKALALHNEGDYKGAIAAYKEMLNQTSDKGRTYQEIALCYTRLGEQDQAVDNYKRAIEAYRRQKEAGGDSVQIGMSIRACEAGIAAARAK